MGIDKKIAPCGVCGRPTLTAKFTKSGVCYPCDSWFYKIVTGQDMSEVKKRQILDDIVSEASKRFERNEFISEAICRGSVSALERKGQ